MSRHLTPIAGLAPEERDAQMVDKGEGVIVMRVMCDSLLPAVMQEMIRQAGDGDEDFRKLKEAVQQGRRPQEEVWGSTPRNQCRQH